MTSLLLTTLIASLPLAAFGLAAAWAVQALGAGPALRLRAWMAALVAPAILAPAALAVQALGLSSPLSLAHGPATAVAPAAYEAAAPAFLPAAALAPSPQLPWTLIVLVIIGLGAGLRLAALALGMQRVARLKARSEAIEDPVLAERLGRGVRQAEAEAPILAGLIRPVILLPRALVARLSPDQAALVCAHERAHLAAGDHLSHLGEEIMIRLYWFNPFMAAARERLAAAREEVRDARALEGADASGRRAYAEALIAALKLAREPAPAAAFTGFRRRGAERRVRAILEPAGGGSRAAVAAAALAATGLAVLLGGTSLALAATPDARPAPQPAPQSAVGAVQSAPLAAPQPAPAPPSGAGRTAPPQPDDRAPRVQHFVLSRTDAPPVPPPPAGADPDAFWSFHTDAPLTDQQRAKVREAIEKARKAIEEVRQAHQLTEADQARIRAARDEARKAIELAVAENRDRVLMSCKVDPKGAVSDCRRADLQPRMFFIGRGPGGVPLPPLPPEPPLPPIPPAG